MMVKSDERDRILGDLGVRKKFVNRNGVHINVEKGSGPKVSLVAFLNYVNSRDILFSLEIYFRCPEDFFERLHIVEREDLDLIDEGKLWGLFWEGHGNLQAEVGLEVFSCSIDRYSDHTEIYCEELMFFNSVPGFMKGPEDFMAYYEENTELLDAVRESADGLWAIRRWIHRKKKFRFGQCPNGYKR